MGNSIVRPMIGYIFIAFFSLTSCSVTPASKPEASSHVQLGEAQESESSLPSSLEAYRSGKDIPTDRYSPIKDIYFDFDRYSLRMDARETLKANAQWLRSNPSVRVMIEGHADERGTAEYNLALGAQRAQAAKDYLVTLGISPDRFSTISYGEELRICQEKTEECWQKQRRVHSATSSVPPSV